MEPFSGHGHDNFGCSGDAEANRREVVRLTRNVLRDIASAVHELSHPKVSPAQGLLQIMTKLTRTNPCLHHAGVHKACVRLARGTYSTFEL